MRQTRFILPAAVAVTLTAAAFFSFARGEEPIAIVSAWARATPPNATTGAAYVTIENRGSADDALLAAASSAAGKVELHETAEQDGVATMRPLENPAIPAGGTLDMQPGGVHLMLMDLSAPLVEGDKVPLTLTFERAGEVSVNIVVVGIAADGPPPGHDHSM